MLSQLNQTYGHSEACHIETKEKISTEQATKLLNDFEGVVVVDEREDGGYPTAVTDARRSY